MNDPKVSIILRSYNEGWALRQTLAGIAAQEYRNWELIAFDSGSTDGSVDLIKRAQPAQLEQIQSSEYVPGRVMNRGMTLATSLYCIFLNADATPQGTNWLRPLATGLFDPRVAAVYGRQVPRPDCQAAYALDYERCFGHKREASQWEHFFSMVSSGVRKDIWSQRRFSNRLQYAEDHEYTLWCKSKGYSIVYCPGSVVMHSHNYTPQEAFKRAYGDSRALALSWPKSPRCFNWTRTVLMGTLGDARRDLLFCLREGRWKEWPQAVRVRWWRRRGTLAGFRQGWRDYRQA